MNEEIIQEENPFVPAPDGYLYANVDKKHRLIVMNQVDAYEQGIPAVEFEKAWDGSLYEKGYAPSKPVDEMKKEVRAVRDQYINDIEWRVSRYRDQKEIQVPTADDEATYTKVLQYMQYLRDYPESSETWYESYPLTYDEWKNQ